METELIESEAKGKGEVLEAEFVEAEEASFVQAIVEEDDEVEDGDTSDDEDGEPIEVKPVQVEHYWREEEVVRIPHTEFIVDERLSGRKFQRSTAHAKGQIASIKSQGQIEPVAYRVAVEGEVYQDKYFGEYTAKGGEPVLLSGFGRHEYIKTIVEAGEEFPNGPEVRALLWNVDERAGFLRGLHANIMRKGLSSVELAHDIHALMYPTPEHLEKGEKAMTGAQIARELGVTEGMISQHLKILDLPDEVLRWQHDGFITFRTCLDLSALAEGDRKGEIEKIRTLIGKGKKVSVSEARKSIRKKAGKKSTKGEVADRSFAELRAFMKGQIEKAGSKNSGRAIVFQAILDYWGGKLDEKGASLKILGAVPEWKRKQTKEE